MLHPSTAIGRLSLFTLTVTVQQAIRGYRGGLDGPDAGQLVWQFGMPLLLVSWVREDFRRSRYWPCFDYDLFLFVAWPIVLPQYLFHTRGVRGIWLFLGFLGPFLLPGVSFGLAYALSRSAGGSSGPP
jgi:hypothetical protein